MRLYLDETPWVPDGKPAPVIEVLEYIETLSVAVVIINEAGRPALAVAHLADLVVIP